MPYTIAFFKDTDNYIRITSKRNYALCIEIKKKIGQIDEKPFIGKPLRNAQKGSEEFI